MTPPQKHTWRFFTAGGFDQVRLDSGADLAHLDQLDQKLWVALSCPTAGLEFDAQTLALIDNDQDGHIRAPELIAAIQWARPLLKDAETLAKGGPLALADITDDGGDGSRLLASARHVLKSLGKAEAGTISVEDTQDSGRILAGMAFNGDGIVTATATTDPDLQQALADIIACLGAQTDCSGEAGIDQASADRFFSEAQAWVDWHAAPASDPALCPLGPDSETAYAAFSVVRGKIDDFFTRCQLAAFDPRAGNLLNGAEEDFKALASRNLAQAGDDVAALPLAYVAADAALPLHQGINPAWADPIAALVDQVVTPLLGRQERLTREQWLDLTQRFTPLEAWLAAKPDTPVAQLELPRLQALTAGPIQARINELIAQDLALETEAKAIAEVDRLVRYVRDLATLANNFVSFRDFYTRKGKAVFQAGTLYLDGRSCDLCVKVLDAGKHGALASLSGVYLAYCDCVRGGEKMTIAAAFTAGDSDLLMVGRNGVFYDREGRDWDATITKLVDHPISIRQAFWSPYKKTAKLIGEQVQKFAAAKAKASDDLAAGAVTDASKKAEAAKPAPTPAAPPAPVDVGKFAGIFAAVGLALGAIGTALASVVTGFLGLKFWQMPIALAGLMLLISGPAMALAFFKLRNRNLGPILDANGWAVNSRAKINIPFGTALTQLARLPEGAERALGDPYAEKKTPWGFYLLLGAVAMALLLYVGHGAGTF